MQPLGPSLKLCFNFMQNKFTIPSICNIAIQILTVLERLHALGIVHLNLRPRKILSSVNPDSSNELFLIDFSNAIKLKKKNGKSYTLHAHQNEYNRKSFLNKFSSLGLHTNLGYSPKDDLESLGYILMYFVQKGKLFVNQAKTKQEKLKFYEERKLKLVPEEDFKDTPREFQYFINFIRMSNLNDYPQREYESLKKIFRKLLLQKGASEKSTFEWVNVYQQCQQKPAPQLSIPKTLNMRAIDNQDISIEQILIEKSYSDSEAQNSSDSESVSEVMSKLKKTKPKFKENLDNFNQVQIVTNTFLIPSPNIRQNDKTATFNK